MLLRVNLATLYISNKKFSAAVISTYSHLSIRLALKSVGSANQLFFAEIGSTLRHVIVRTY